LKENAEPSLSLQNRNKAMKSLVDRNITPFGANSVGFSPAINLNEGDLRMKSF
jgi:hypothetical protein